VRCCALFGGDVPSGASGKPSVGTIELTAAVDFRHRRADFRLSQPTLDDGLFGNRELIISLDDDADWPIMPGAKASKEAWRVDVSKGWKAPDTDGGKREGAQCTRARL
jgi:hypothetical protein